MKTSTILSTIALLILGMGIKAQESPKQDNSSSYEDPIHPYQRFGVTFPITDMALQRLTLEMDYRITGPHKVGFKAGTFIGDISLGAVADELMTSQFDNWHGSIYYKLYLPIQSNLVDSYYFIRPTFSYQNANFNYTIEDWYSVENEGATYWGYGDINRTYALRRYGGSFEFGIENTLDWFYFEISFGLGYYQLDDIAAIPEEFELEGPFAGQLVFHGFTPRLGYKIGAYIF